MKKSKGSKLAKDFVKHFKACCNEQKRVIMVDVGGVDWTILRKQKHYLVTMSMDDDDENIEGLINFLDTIQDQAADVIGENEVFGRLK